MYQYEVNMQFLYFVLAGVLGGVLAGMGMGGGTLTLPILVLVMGVEQITAQFANLIAFLPSGSAALFVHAKNGLIRKDNLIFMLLPSLAACVLCSFWASEANGVLLKKLFGGFLVLVAVFSLAAKIVKEVKKP